jgi:hypothetical protein
MSTLSYDALLKILHSTTITYLLTTQILAIGHNAPEGKISTPQLLRRKKLDQLFKALRGRTQRIHWL